MGFIKKYLYDSDRPKRKYDNITARDVKKVIKESIITNDTSWGNYETNQQREVKMYAFKKVVELGLEAVPSLYKLLKDSDSRVRYSAIEALLEINTNENINDPKFYNPIIKLKYDTNDSIRASAELAEVLRDNLILIKKDRHNRLDNTYSSDDDTIYPTTKTYDKKPKKRLSDELIEENDEYMDDIIAGRLKIIKDCLNAIVTAKNGKIPSTLIVPTLIAQIDGIQTEFLLKNNFTISRRQFVHTETGEKMWQKDAWRDTYAPEDVFSSITNDIILDVLFATVYPGESIKTPINFSRHKIMHGERLDYGTKYNVIRTFLILDFLNDLL